VILASGKERGACGSQRVAAMRSVHLLTYLAQQQEQKSEPITGYSADGYAGKGMVSMYSAPDKVQQPEE